MPNGYAWWIGANKVGTNGVWVWYTSESVVPVHETIWGAGQPDNYQGPEECMNIKPEMGYRWNDDKCHFLKGYICESHALNVIG